MSYRPFVYALIASLGLFLLTTFGLLGPMSALLHVTTQPVLASESQAQRKTINFLTIIASLRDLAKENAELVARTHELEAKLSELKEVDHENEILRQELNFVKESKDTHIPAQLIGRTPAGAIKDLIINRGTADGLSVGQPVLAQGHLIGLVREVSERQSTVQLITHPRSIIPVLLQDSRSTGLLRGGIGGLVMTDILIDATVKVDEMVVTSGLGGDLPAGIPVGKVLAVTAQKGDITKRASLTAAVDVSKLEVVFVRKVGR